MASMLLSASSPRAPHPRLTTGKVTLKPHQLAMIHRCGEIEATSDVLVMNDKPGSGKTYAILGYLLHRKQAGYRGATIIFVPHHILTQWNESISNLIGDSLSIFNLTYGDIDHVQDIIEQRDLILAPSVLCSSVAKVLKSARPLVPVPCFVLDEALALHVMYADVPAEKVSFVSGDCDLVEHFPPMALDWRAKKEDVTCQCEDRFVASSFDLEEPRVVKKRCTSLLLERVLIPAVGGSEGARERLNALDFFHKSAPTVSDEKELIRVLLEYTHRSRESNADRIEICKSALEQQAPRGFGDEEIQRKIYEDEIKECSEKLRASEAMIGTIERCIKENGLCVACFDGSAPQMLISPCHHALCEACGAEPPLECPVCGATRSGCLQKPEVESVHAREDGLPNKLEGLFEIVEKAGPTAKILLFSKHVRIYRKIQDGFRSRGVSFAELEGGSQEHIDSIVRDFKGGDVKVLMVDSSLFACGLNIENTTDVIMLHKMDQHTERPVVGRAQRPGRTCQLSVWHLLNTNEVE